jgi:hypothetical protein
MSKARFMRIRRASVIDLLRASFVVAAIHGCVIWRFSSSPSGGDSAFM